MIIYKTNIRISNKHNNTMSCLLLHVLVELHHFQGVYQPMSELTGARNITVVICIIS